MYLFKLLIENNYEKKEKFVAAFRRRKPAGDQRISNRKIKLFFG